MIGLALITFVAVLGQGVRTSFTGAVDELFVADYALIGPGFDAGLEQGRRRRRRGAGRRVVSEIRGGDAKLDGDTIHVTGVDEQPDQGRRP